MNILNPSDYQTLGSITRTHGVKGKFYIELQSAFQDDPEDLDFIFITREGLPIPFAVNEIEFKDDITLIVSCELISTREEAAKWIGEKVLIHKDFFSETETDLTLDNLIGFKIETENGKLLGIISDFIDISGNPLFEIKIGDTEILLPANDDLVIEINWEEQTIIYNVPEGLIELNSETEENESDEL